MAVRSRHPGTGGYMVGTGIIHPQAPRNDAGQMVKPAAGVPPMTAGGRRGRFSPGRHSHLHRLPHRSRLRRSDCHRHQGVPQRKRPWLTRGRPGSWVRVGDRPDRRRGPGPAWLGRGHPRERADLGWFGAVLVRRYCDQCPTQRVALVKIPRNERRWRDAGGHHGR